MYTSANAYFQAQFGCKVYKLSLDAGFTCPNRDGTLSTGGCIFCSPFGGGEFAEGCCDSVKEQLERAKARVRSKNPDGKFRAYFQAFTNTYAPVETLERLYAEAIQPEDVVGLAIGTRLDCLPPQTVALLEKINHKKPVFVELGLQTTNPKTVAYIRRGYENEVYFDAVQRLWHGSRDSARTPVQWSDEENAGFTTGKPWFYVNENYVDVNVAAQEKDEHSVLNFYRKAIALRKNLSCVRNGNYVEYNKLSASLYTYSREDDKQKILVVCSFTEKEVAFNAPKNFDMASGQLILQNYANVDPARLKPYEVRVYLWEK